MDAYRKLPAFGYDQQVYNNENLDFRAEEEKTYKISNERLRFWAFLIELVGMKLYV